MSPAKKAIPKFPLLQDADPNKPDDWAPALLGHWMGLQPQPDNLVQEARGRLDAWPVSLTRLQKGASSWNWDWMLGAAALFEPGRRDTSEVADWWIELLAYQTKEKLGPGFLSQFEGSEPRSSTYTAWRVGSVLAVLAWASGQQPVAPLGNPAKALMVLGRRWLEIWCSIQALGMVPWTDREGYFNKQFWWDGPTPSPVGERSTHSFDPDTPALWTLLTGWPVRKLDRGSWPVEILQKRKTGPLLTDETAALLRGYVRDGSGLDAVVAKIESTSFWGTFHFIRLPNGLLVYRDERRNNNSPTHLYSWAPSETQETEFGYPVPEGARGRGKNAPKGGAAFLQPELPDRPQRILCHIGPNTTETALPDWRPESRVVADADGVRQV